MARWTEASGFETHFWGASKDAKNYQKLHALLVLVLAAGATDGDSLAARRAVLCCDSAVRCPYGGYSQPQLINYQISSLMPNTDHS